MDFEMKPIDKTTLEYPKIPLFEFIEKETREFPKFPKVTSDDPAPSIIVRRTRAIKWFLNGKFGGAWVVSVDDETDFDKLATALYIARRIRKSKFWAWWYKTFYSIKNFFVGAGITGDEWPDNLS